jgi:hypothetical protein
VIVGLTVIVIAPVYVTAEFEHDILRDDIWVVGAEKPFGLSVDEPDAANGATLAWGGVNLALFHGFTMKLI